MNISLFVKEMKHVGYIHILIYLKTTLHVRPRHHNKNTQ